MKKISLLFVLVFTYFICVVDVYAFSTSCRIVTANERNTQTGGCPFSGMVRNNTYYLGLGSGDSESYWSDIYYADYGANVGEFVNNYNLFGYYNDGNIVGYTRPYHADIWNDTPGLRYYHSQETGVDNNGNATFYIFSENTEYVDISFGTNFTPNGTNRLDFGVHVNLTNIPDKVRNNILGNLQVNPVMPTIGGSYCTAKYDYDIIRISCAFDYSGQEVVVRLTQYDGREKNYNSDVVSYNYYGYFDISEYTIVFSHNKSIDELDTEESPNGNYFNDYYDYIESNSNSYFGNLPSYDTITSISSIVIAPLRILQQIKGCGQQGQDVTQCNNPLPIYAFGDNYNNAKFKFELHDGYDLFWGKCTGLFFCSNARRINDSVILGSNVCALSKVNLIKTFRQFWNLIFGGFIIYLLGKKMVKVAINLFDPDKLGMEVL